MPHTSHQMQFTSLLNYFPSWSEQEFNQKFRQQTKRDIVELLQQHKNLTDRELANMLGYKDPNKVRPRRNELAQGKYDRLGNVIIPSVLVEDTKRTCLVSGKLCIAWKLSQDNLLAYMKE